MKAMFLLMVGAALLAGCSTHQGAASDTGFGMTSGVDAAGGSTSSIGSGVTGWGARSFGPDLSRNRFGATGWGGGGTR